MSDFDRLMGDSLKAIRDDHVSQIEAEIPAARRQIASKIRGRRFTFVMGGVVVAAAAVAVALFIAQSVPDIDRAQPIPPSGPPAVVARIDVPGVTAMEPAMGALWVVHAEGLVSIDPLSRAVVDESPVNADAIAADSEAIFAINSNDRSVSRLPFGTDEAATSVSMEGTPTAIAASEEAVWVAAAVGPDGYSEITTYTPHLEVPGASAAALQERVVSAMTHDGESLWIAASGSGAPGESSRLAASSQDGLELHRFDRAGRETVSGLSTAEGSAADIAVGEGAAWVLRQPTKSGGNTITRVDLETDEITERAVSFEDSVEAIAVGEGYLWVTTAPLGMNMPDDARATLHRIDPTTLEAVGEPIEVAGPGSKLEVGYGFIWVSDPNNKQIVQIDPNGGGSSPEPEPSPTAEATERPEVRETPERSSDEAFAMWPETTPDEAAAECSRVSDEHQPFRRSPDATALRFAADHLRWPDADIRATDWRQGPPDYQSLDVARDSSPEAPQIDLTVRYVAEDCWSVYAFRTINESVPEDAPTGLSVSNVDGTTRVTFDLEREAAGREVATVRLEVGSAETRLSTAEFELESGIQVIQEASDEPGAFLVVLEDSDGRAVGAIGMALPAGDFTAG